MCLAYREHFSSIFLSLSSSSSSGSSNSSSSSCCCSCSNCNTSKYSISLLPLTSSTFDRLVGRPVFPRCYGSTTLHYTWRRTRCNTTQDFYQCHYSPFFSITLILFTIYLYKKQFNIFHHFPLSTLLPYNLSTVLMPSSSSSSLLYHSSTSTIAIMDSINLLICYS